MLLTSIEMRNFRGFRGLHKIFLAPMSADRPIVLFGGENGAGKTSILEATRIALFGRRAAGDRVTNSDYESFLSEQITWPQPGHQRLRKAGVAVELEHSSGGHRFNYRVDRGWELRGNHLHEDLIVLKDGQVIPGLDRQHWQAFVNELMPPALAGLFFFDGERIQSLADDTSGIEFASAVRSLLGIDMVRQLQTDLDTFLERSGKREGGTSDKTAVNNSETRIHALKRELDQSYETQGAIQSRLDLARSHLRLARDRFIEEGGEFARERAAEEAREAQLLRERARVEAELHELVGGLLPIALAPDLIQTLLKTIDIEEDRERREAAAVGWGEARAHVITTLSSDPFWDSRFLSSISIDARRIIADQLAKELNTNSRSNPGSEIENVHIVTSTEREILRHQLTRAVKDTAAKARKLGFNREQIDQDLAEARANIRRAPHEEALLPLEEALTEQASIVARLESDIATVVANQEALKRQIEDEERDRDRLAERISSDLTAEVRRQLAARARIALKDFEGRLAANRRTQLEAAISSSFNRLARKREFIGAVSLDPTTFQCRLFDPQGNEIPRQLLSAGEKQIFAISLLWALAQVSGRRLPMIIDTPLGRLDSTHRSQLVRHYFPFAAQQVVILSTDTEVDRTWYETLMPNVSRSYRIDHDSTNHSAMVCPGYFWSEDYMATSGAAMNQREQESDEIRTHNSPDSAPAVESPATFG